MSNRMRFVAILGCLRVIHKPCRLGTTDEARAAWRPSATRWRTEFSPATRHQINSSVHLIGDSSDRYKAINLRSPQHLLSDPWEKFGDQRSSIRMLPVWHFSFISPTFLYYWCHCDETKMNIKRLAGGRNKQVLELISHEPALGL
jgi:hypothetical protein